MEVLGAQDLDTSRKGRKRRATESPVTPSYRGFRQPDLNTAAGWGWRIFLWEEVVQGWYHIRVMCAIM